MGEQVDRALGREVIPAQPGSLEKALEVTKVVAVSKDSVGRAAAGGEVGEEVARDRHSGTDPVQNLDRAPATSSLRPPR